jgi:hypothetical protein
VLPDALPTGVDVPGVRPLGCPAAGRGPAAGITGLPRVPAWRQSRECPGPARRPLRPAGGSVSRKMSRFHPARVGLVLHPRFPIVRPYPAARRHPGRCSPEHRRGAAPALRCYDRSGGRPGLGAFHDRGRKSSPRGCRVTVRRPVSPRVSCQEHGRVPPLWRSACREVPGPSRCRPRGTAPSRLSHRYRHDHPAYPVPTRCLPGGCPARGVLTRCGTGPPLPARCGTGPEFTWPGAAQGCNPRPAGQREPAGPHPGQARQR